MIAHTIERRVPAERRAVQQHRYAPTDATPGRICSEKADDDGLEVDAFLELVEPADPAEDEGDDGEIPW